MPHSYTDLGLKGLSLLSFCILLSCQARQTGALQQSTRVHVAGTSSLNVALPVYIAHALEYDKQQGLEIVQEDLPGGAKALQAMLGGSVDVADVSYELALQLTAEGRDVRSFLSLINRALCTRRVAEVYP